MTDKLIERLLKEWGRWHHLNEMAIASNKTPSDSEIDIEVEAWNSVRRAYSEAATALQDAQKEIERLTVSRDAARKDVMQAARQGRERAEAAERERDELRRALEVTDEMVANVHERMMSELFLVCQPDRGDVFSFMDDRKDVVRAALEALGDLRRVRAALNQEKQI